VNPEFFMRSHIIDRSFCKSNRRRVLRLSVLVAGTFVLSLGLFVAPGAAETINFSDLGPACTPGVPGSYHGLLWSSNFQAVCNSLYAADFGNTYGAASGYGATNGSSPGSGVSSVTIGSGTFDFNGASFSSFAENNGFAAFSSLSLQLLGYRPGDPIDIPTFITTFDLDPATYVVTPFSWTSLSALVFGGGNGPSADLGTIYGVDGLSWLMTDLKINEQVSPVPDDVDSLLLLGMGLIGIVVIGRHVSSESIPK
jgi:hypothetical protein